MKTTLAIDAMGGDFGPSVLVPGAVEAARGRNLKLLLVGQTDTIETELAKLSLNDVDVEVAHASEVVEMNEKPSDILRRKKDASIHVACRMVRDGQAHGVVSAGHSGATMACSMFIMGRVPGVERPSLATFMPTEKGRMLLLDVGGNVDCKPYHLFQFGLMADAFVRDMLGLANPSLGLLSIGEEEGKGNSQVKESYELLKMAQNINFVGNVEGRDLFTGTVDIVVCDGFVGNVALKLSEGLSGSMQRLLKRELFASFITKIGALLSKSAFKRFARIVDYDEYGGAPLLGLKGISIVCHGRSSPKAITSAVRMAAQFVDKKTNERLIESVSANEELTRYSRSC